MAISPEYLSASTESTRNSSFTSLSSSLIRCSPHPIGPLPVETYTETDISHIIARLSKQQRKKEKKKKLKKKVASKMKAGSAKVKRAVGKGGLAALWVFIYPALVLTTVLDDWTEAR
ncbi:hypothetical protein N7456_010412 [Penicillium angulare]|uniref:Transmembrane protein n=1 Tax=Penicillium angulare TaxID=116970 RepID=A0A9W9F6J9_9EURO|nr:hypothetical protein N7456_010412 [Penicillium angulare]